MSRTNKPLLPTENQIRLRAYDKYVARGREDGHDVEDWIEAERELLIPIELQTIGTNTPSPEGKRQLR